MEYKNIYYPESRSGTFTDVDGTIAFYLRVNGLVDSESVILDVGCGRGAFAEDPTYLPARSMPRSRASNTLSLRSLEYAFMSGSIHEAPPSRNAL